MAIIARRREEDEQTHEKTKIDQQSQQQQEADRISHLPDEILHPILSLLTLKEACITSSLSMRWRTLFPTIPSLHLHRFSFRSDMDIDYWLETVRDILESRRAPVRICTILADFLSDYCEDFGNIICFLCNDGIQELSIHNDVEYYYYWRFYTVPACLYFCRTLTRLELSRCILNVSSKFSLLRSLNTLKIVECLVVDCDLQLLISGCPVVEMLTVENCFGLRNLAVYADKLAVLHITTHMPLAVSIVNAPLLESVTVRFSGYGTDDFPGMYFPGEDRENGSDVDDGPVTDYGGNDAGESEASRLVRLLESLGDVQNLSLEFQNSYTKRLRKQGVLVVTLRSLLPKMKKLTLKMQLSSTFILSIVSCLLNSCPNLEDLSIGDHYWYDGNKYSYLETSVLDYRSVLDYWDHRMPSDCMRNTLTTVTLYLVVGYRWKYCVKLVKFLLNNASVLKNLVICCYHKEEELSKMVEDLHKEIFPLSPASPCDMVEFKTHRRWMLYALDVV